MPRFRTQQMRINRAPRNLTWTSTVSTADFVVPANGKLALSGNLDAIFENLGKPTIMRIRGEVIFKVTAGTDGNVATIGVGIALANNLANTAAVLPGPVAESDFPWIWHSFVSLEQQGGADQFTPSVNVVRLIVDSKAMRRVPPATELFVMFENVSAAGTLACDVMANFRILLKS